MEHQNYHAFISYRRELSFSTAMMILDRLEKKGLRCFLDQEELRNGTFDTKILSCIKNTRNFILVLPPNALDRCTEPRDWLTREILAAMDHGCNIIPLFCDGYTFPAEDNWDPEMPLQLRQLPRYNGVFLSPHYLDATMDRLIEFMQDIPFSVQTRNDRSVFSSANVEEFFKDHLEQGGLEGLDMAFHAGAVWHTGDDKLKTITAVAKLGIPIRVLINTPEAANAVAQHMRRRNRYVSFSDTIADWQDFALAHPNVQVRICDIPLLHTYYDFHTESGSRDLLCLKYYIYGNFQIDGNHMQVFRAPSEHFKLYRQEFEFLWNKAQ